AARCRPGRCRWGSVATGSRWLVLSVVAESAVEDGGHTTVEGGVDASGESAAPEGGVLAGAAHLLRLHGPRGRRIHQGQVRRLTGRQRPPLVADLTDGCRTLRHGACHVGPGELVVPLEH